MPVILLNVVLTDLPSKCSQSKGAGLLGLKSEGDSAGLGPDCDGRGVPDAGGGTKDEDEP